MKIPGLSTLTLSCTRPLPPAMSSSIWGSREKGGEVFGPGSTLSRLGGRERDSRRSKRCVCVKVGAMQHTLHHASLRQEPVIIPDALRAFTTACLYCMHGKTVCHTLTLSSSACTAAESDVSASTAVESGHTYLQGGKGGGGAGEIKRQQSVA